MQTNNFDKIELFEIKLYVDLTVCKCVSYWIVSDTKQYFKPFIECEIKLS